MALADVAPVFAAIAAITSWASVFQSRKAFRASQLPQLDGRWINRVDGASTLEIHNTGSGFARVPHFYVVNGGVRAHGRVVDTGPLSPGQGARVRVEVPHHQGGATVVGVLFCLDAAGRWHVWSWDGRHKEPRRFLRRSSRLLGFEEALRMMHPSSSGQALKQASCATEPMPVRPDGSQS